MKHIVCFHLYNDYSGSPKVLAMTLKVLTRKSFKIDLITSRGGILDSLEENGNIKMHTYPYRFSDHWGITMIRYTGIQLYTFFFAFRYLFQKNVIFYINTILPAGPALAGKLMGKRIVYHYHENAFVKGRFYRFLCRMMQGLADEIICVSEYQRGFLKRQQAVETIPNAVPDSFCRQFSEHTVSKKKEKRVLMLSSLKLYKGTLEFIQLSHELPFYAFDLIINNTQAEINHFLQEHKIVVPTNLHIYERQSDVVPFYREASLVLNLSNKDLFIETFGLTALEAMVAGLPVIVPTQGGISEMVEEGVNGYKIDVQDLNLIVQRIKQLFSDPDLYNSLASNAKRMSSQYDSERMCSRIVSLFEKK